MPKKEITPEERLYNLALILCLAGGVLFILYCKVLMPVLPAMPCVLWEMLGIYCPGCGGTRAVLALFHGQILKSLWYHPLVLYTVVILGGFMLTHTMEKLHVLHIKGWKFHDWYLYVALGIVITNWVLKNVLLLAFGITL